MPNNNNSPAGEASKEPTAPVAGTAYYNNRQLRTREFLWQPVEYDYEARKHREDGLIDGRPVIWSHPGECITFGMRGYNPIIIFWSGGRRLVSACLMPDLALEYIEEFIDKLIETCRCGACCNKRAYPADGSGRSS